jgi:hypothetical protein
MSFFTSVPRPDTAPRAPRIDAPPRAQRDELKISQRFTLNSNVYVINVPPQ